MASPPKYGLRGAARPSDFAGEYNQLLFMIRQVLSKVNVAALCEVVAVSGGGVGPVGYVDLQPLVNQVDGFGNAIPQGVLHNIPYMRIQGGANAIIIDPQIGDIGAAVFSDRDISSVKATGKQANPGSRRRFDVADGLYFGGMLNGTPTQYIQFLANQINIVSPWINLSSWVGKLAPFAMSAIPNGWLACPTTQTLVSLSTYPSLIVLGTAWGGDGVSTVGLPYLATGYTFVQGVIATLTHGDNLQHTHRPVYGGTPSTATAIYANPPAGSLGAGASGMSSVVLTIENEGGPDNLAAGMGVKWCVKY